MPRQVFEVFLSSTARHLAPHRAKAREIVERLEQSSICMETFGARPDRPLDTCRQEVESADALVVIVGHRYGWVPSDKEGGDGKTTSPGGKCDGHSAPANTAQPPRLLQLDSRTLWFSSAGSPSASAASRRKVKKTDITQALAGMGD